MESATAEKISPQNGPKKARAVSPLNGQPTPGGRPKGVQNRVTRTIREAVEMAARDVTDSQGRKGLAAWLLEQANGNIAQKQIFAAMIAKVVPLQVQAQGSGGVTINLGWLNGRQLINVTPTSQSAPNLLIHNDDTRTTDHPATEQPAIVHQADETTPHPPIERQEGGG